MAELYCNSCKVKIANLSGTVRFKCPDCGKTEIVRCPHCRKIGAQYTCAACAYTGP